VKKTAKPNEVIIVSGDDVKRLSPSFNRWTGKVECFNVILDKGLPRGIRIDPDLAAEMLMDYMRGKRFEAVKAIKWHWIGRQPKDNRKTVTTLTNDDQLTDIIVESIDHEPSDKETGKA
jgi:hypothetical protein